jgi:hypothetical protein
MSAVTLSPPRRVLAGEIERHAAAVERFDRIRAARSEAWRPASQATDAVAAAEKTLQQAIAAEPAMLTARLLGEDVGDVLTVAEATEALAAARAGLDRARRTRAAVDAAFENADREVHAAKGRVEDAIGSVVAERVPKLLAALEGALDKIADLRTVLHLLPGLSQRDLDRASVVMRPGNALAGSAWRVALAALRTDAGTLLPDVADPVPPAERAA